MVKCSHATIHTKPYGHGPVILKPDSISRFFQFMLFRGPPKMKPRKRGPTKTPFFQKWTGCFESHPTNNYQRSCSEFCSSAEESFAHFWFTRCCTSEPAQHHWRSLSTCRLCVRDAKSSGTCLEQYLILSRRATKLYVTHSLTPTWQVTHACFTASKRSSATDVMLSGSLNECAPRWKITCAQLSWVLPKFYCCPEFVIRCCLSACTSSTSIT